MPAMDESWWESVLAEEGRHGSSHSGRAANREAAAEEPARPVANWDQIKDLYARDQIVSLRVAGFNRGGLLVEGEELSGFVPFSHLVDLAGKTDVDREASLAEYVGRSINLKVIECVPEDGRVVFSERAALAESGKRAALFTSLKPGATVSGQVTNVTDFGVFIDLGGVEGLIHISELSWGRVVHPGHIAKVGQTLDVQVLDLAPERCRVALSLKRLTPNPWKNAETDFPVGGVMPAVITTITSYGAFARLQAGVEGLIHASEMDLQPGAHLKDVLAEGQSVQVRVLHVDADHQRMGLSLRLD